MPKILLWSVAGLVSAVIVIAGGTVVMNSFDSDLRPEVKQILTASPKLNDQQKHAFFYLLGLYAGAHRKNA